MVKPMATQPRRKASSTEAVTAGIGSLPEYSESELLAFRMSGTCPAYSAAPASRNPSGAA